MTDPLKKPMEEARMPEEAIGMDSPILPEEAIAPEILKTPEEQALEELHAELANWKDKAYRAAAEADNTRKRAAADVADARQYAVSSFARDMLTVADNMARALAAPEGNEKAIRDGVQMVAGQLSSTLEKYGVQRIAVAAGDTPNPDLHQVMLEVEGTPGQIVAELQAGYTLNGRLLRAAMVSVGKRENEF